MYAPILEIDTRKIEENARKLHTFCARRGVEPDAESHYQASPARPTSMKTDFRA